MKVLAALLLVFIAVGCSVKHRQCEQVMSRYVPPSDGKENSDAYHVVVFSYQNSGWRSKLFDCHTYCTWVHTSNKKIIDQVDISWGPRDGGSVKVMTTMVPGANKSLAETMQDAANHKITYCVLRTDKTFFDAALKHRDDLKNYIILDSSTRPTGVNCIHACSDVAGYLETGTLHGASASKAVANFYIKTNKAQPCKDDWVFKTLMAK